LLFLALSERANISAVCCLVVLPILLISVCVCYFPSVSWQINDDDDDDNLAEIDKKLHFLNEHDQTS